MNSTYIFKPFSEGFYWIKHESLNKGNSIIVNVKKDKHENLCVYFLNTKKYILLDSIKNALWHGPIEDPLKAIDPYYIYELTNNQNNDNTELHNCPRCGGKPKIKNIDVSYHGSPIYETQIVCTNCLASTDLYASTSTAIEKWNNGIITLLI